MTSRVLVASLLWLPLACDPSETSKAAPSPLAADPSQDHASPGSPRGAAANNQGDAGKPRGATDELAAADPAAPAGRDPGVIPARVGAGSPAHHGLPRVDPMPALRPQNATLATLALPEGTAIERGRYPGGELVTLTVPYPAGDAFALYLEGGSSCAVDAATFDPAFPGSQNGFVQGAEVQAVLVNEGTPRGGRGAARYADDGQTFFGVAQCDDGLGVVCVAYRVTEAQAALAQHVCDTLAPGTS